MEQKVHFSKQPKIQKILYAVVIMILIVTAIVVGTVSANNRKTPSVTLPENNNTQKPAEETPKKEDPAPEQKKTPVFVSPAVGTVLTPHSTTVPVFSDTLGEWRMHTGIDISTEENAPVFAVTDGTVSAVKNDAMLGVTVEIDHGNGLFSVYQNLDAASVNGLKAGNAVSAGDKIGNVGDSSVSELAEESHLHFAMKQNGSFVDPLDFFSEEVQKVSLGINNGVEA